MRAEWLVGLSPNVGGSDAKGPGERVPQSLRDYPPACLPVLNGRRVDVHCRAEFLKRPARCAAKVPNPVRRIELDHRHGLTVTRAPDDSQPIYPIF
jgi:hypothetical protein